MAAVARQREPARRNDNSASPKKDAAIGDRMATEGQIAANPANAKHSTRPTAVCKMKSSRNAFRHGLSLPLGCTLEASTGI